MMAGVFPFSSRVRAPRRPTVRVRGEILSDDTTLLLASARRERLAEDGLCINGAKHGKATHGVRCVRCVLVHRYGAAFVNEHGVDELARELGLLNND